MGEQLSKRVLLVGWDAADWRIIRPLMEQGHMPALSRLVAAGAHGNLATIHPALSPMLWTSIATGKRPDRHGIHGFLEPIPDGSGVRPVSSTSRRCKSLWNIAHQNNLRSLIVSWYASHPAEPVDGVVVSDRFFSDPRKKPLSGSVSPAELTDQIADLRVNTKELLATDMAAFIPRFNEIKQEESKPLHALANIIAKCASVQSVATRLMLDNDWDLAAVFFDGLDHIGHWFMPYHPPYRPGVSEREYELYKDVVTSAYRFFDMMLEALMAHAGPDTTLILVSDHGFKSDDLRPSGSGWENPVNWHRQLGIALASGPGIKADEKFFGATVLDITPTVLHLLGLPIGADMDGRPWLEITDPPVKADTVFNWDDVGGDAGLHSEGLREDPAEAMAAIQQLVDLGYVAPLGDDVQETIRQTLRDNKINLVLSVFDSRRAEQAQPIVDELLEEYPDDAHILSIAARTALLRGESAPARKHIEKAIALDKRSATLVSLLAEAAMIDNEYGQAVELYRELIDIGIAGSEALSAHCRLGDALVRLDERDSAEAEYKRGLAYDPDHAPAWIGLSKLALYRGDADLAVDHATHAVSLVHAYPKAHFQLGRALVAAERLEDAVTAFTVCASMAPGLLPCIQQLADLKQKLNHPDAQKFALRAATLRVRSRFENSPGRETAQATYGKEPNRVGIH
ncbi:MAG: alkaline phosphatase family protein [Phycisphaerales bacterium]